MTPVPPVFSQGVGDNAKNVNAQVRVYACQLLLHLLAANYPGKWLLLVAPDQAILVLSAPRPTPLCVDPRRL